MKHHRHTTVNTQTLGQGNCSILISWALWFHFIDDAMEKVTKKGDLQETVIVSVCPVTYNWRKPCVCVPTWHRRCQLGSKRLRMCEEDNANRGPFPLFAALCISTKFSAKGLTYKGASNNLWEMGNSQYLLILFFCDFVEVLSYTKTLSRFLRLMSSKWLS